MNEALTLSGFAAGGGSFRSAAVGPLTRTGGAVVAGAADVVVGILR